MSNSNSTKYQQNLFLICLAILVDDQTPQKTMLSDAIRHQVTWILDEVLNDLV